MKPRIALLLLLASAAFAQNRRAPGFSLPDTNFVQYDLQDLRGKVLLLEFLRTDCPTCKTLTNTIAEVNDKFGDKVRVIYVVTPPDTQASVAAYVKDQSMRGPVLFDCGQVTASYTGATARNPTVHLPHLFIIDAEGFIRAHASADGNPGELLAKSISAAVEEVLSKPQPK
jgi:peroxiredoxin